MGKGFRAFLKERIREKILSTALVLSLISLMSLLESMMPGLRRLVFSVRFQLG